MHKWCCTWCKGWDEHELKTLEISQMLLLIWGRPVSNLGWSTSQSAIMLCLLWTAQGYIYYQNELIYQNGSKQDLKRTNKQIPKMVFKIGAFAHLKRCVEMPVFVHCHRLNVQTKKLVEHVPRAFSCKMRLNNITKNTAKQHVPPLVPHLHPLQLQDFLVSWTFE